MYVYMYMYVTYIQHAHILDIWECRVRKCVCVCDCAGARAPVREPADHATVTLSLRATLLVANNHTCTRHTRHLARVYVPSYKYSAHTIKHTNN